MVSVSATADVRSLGARSRRRLVGRLPIPLILTAVAAAVTWMPFWSQDAALGLINVLVPVSFVAIGMVLAQDREQRTTGLLMLVAGPCYIMSWWWGWPPSWHIGPLPLMSFIFGYFWFVCGGLALVRYPGARLARRYERIYFAAMALWIGVGKTAAALVSTPSAVGFADGAWWPTLYPDPYVLRGLERVFDLGTALIALILLPVLVLKLRRSRGLDRIDSVPVIVAACAVTVCGSSYFVAGLADLPEGVAAALRAATGVAALVTPLAFLATVLRRGLVRSSVADLVLRLAESPSVDAVESAIRMTLQDPTLVLLFWLPDDGIYVDTAGNPAGSDELARWVVPVLARDGSPLARLLLAPPLRRHRSLVESVVVAGGLALENGRLHAAVAAQLAEVRASRARIVEGALAERRRLERDLHDGAQQSLLAVTSSLARARLVVGADSPARDALDRARADLGSARRELRDLARGIHPAVLSQSGLAPAIEGIAERLGIAVVLDVLTERLPASVEATAYFVAAEALTNAAKHAGVCRVKVTIRRDVGVSVLVADDGTGGASGGPGTGLSGLEDRVRALGGELAVTSPVGKGTSVRAVIPCES